MVTPLKFVGDGQALIAALRAGHPGAAAAFYDQHAAHVHRTLRSILGADADVPDLLQEVFIRAIDGIKSLDDLEQVRSWLTTITVFTARAHIRRRTRRKSLFTFSPQMTSEDRIDPPSTEARFALRETYELLDELPVNERMAFVLRFVDGLTLPDGAEACRISLAHIGFSKRDRSKFSSKARSSTRRGTRKPLPSRCR